MVFICSFIFTCYYSYNVIDNMIPDEINILNNQDMSLKSNKFIKYDVKSEGLAVSTSSNISKVSITNTNKFTNKNVNYTLEANLFGIIHFKDIKVNVINVDRLIPCGFQVGIYLKTQGVMIIGVGEITGSDGMVYNPAQNIVKPDDYIVSLNGVEVGSKSQLMYLINKYGENDIILGINRDNNYIEVKVSPVNVSPCEYKLGIWVRDDTQGIGTLTYMTPSGEFGALGHGISDVDTGALLTSNEGKLYNSYIWGIRKGENGKPGGLLGSIDYDDANKLGEINKNTNHGIFGKGNEELIEKAGNKSIPVGLKNDIKKGEATIQCQMEGEVKEYKIEIKSIDYANNEKNKSMVIQITDPELLSKTNGIVQGMSGSPIMQDGKIIGAVTHVFVNDSTKGYGIFIENMLETMK